MSPKYINVLYLSRGKVQLIAMDMSSTQKWFNPTILEMCAAYKWRQGQIKEKETGVFNLKLHNTDAAISLHSLYHPAKSRSGSR